MFHRSNRPDAGATSVRPLADEAIATGVHALDSTREFAAQALERAAEKMRDLRYGVADTASAAQRQVGRYASATRHYVAEQPVRSAVIAAGVGALVAAAILLARRQRGNRF
ncbi:MAG: hypothetical protein V4609_16305 [Pseudomonadota bacterium]